MHACVIWQAAPLPSLLVLEYVSTAASVQKCPLGRVSGLLALALTLAPQVEPREGQNSIAPQGIEVFKQISGVNSGKLRGE